MPHVQRGEDFPRAICHEYFYFLSLRSTVSLVDLRESFTPISNDIEGRFRTSRVHVIQSCWSYFVRSG